MTQDAVSEAISMAEEAKMLWADPLPIEGELLAVQPFNAARLLPETLRGWITDISERMPCPPDFVAAAAIVALGSVIGARCVIKPKQRDDWMVAPNLWGGIVGLPSSKKSPAMIAAFKPLDQIVAVALKEYEEEMQAFLTEKLKQDAYKEALEKELKRTASRDVSKGIGGSDE